MHFEHFVLTDLSRIQIIYFRKNQKVDFKVRTLNLRQAVVDKNFTSNRIVLVQIQSNHFWAKLSNTRSWKDLS